ncbi:unnamed protein product [Kluyveromyces dobzhanskii CBS 2104]|uniref:WGS project CCBQ000000000 data, contig 00099 n=1 Tax=Kluyveromyces dobzhanskii CBS 2104 TaxID=1427455 RepID=A0A0A8L4H3_9SACH|nr:unnamed protein product [Kluyveromyces dobzhanskii CBS 2104]
MMNVNLLTPCLIFSKLARSLSLAKLLQLYVVPIFYAGLIGTSYISGTVVSRIFELDIDETNFVIGTSVFPNSNSLPVSLMMSLAYTLPQLAWDEIPGDSGDNIASRGVLYLIIFQQIDQTLRWSWGVHKLLKWSSDHEDSNNVTEQSSISTMIRENDDDATKLHKFYGHLRYHWDNMLSYMNGPLYSIFFSIIVASIRPLQRQLFEADGFLQNAFTPAVDQMAVVSIPLILLVLGANLYPSESTPLGSHNARRIVLASIISRMFLPALILLPFIAFTVKYLRSSILTDPVFLLVSFLLTTSPPAIQLTQLTQLNEFFEFEIVNVLFWGYAVMTLPMTIIMVTLSLRVLEWANQ